MVRLAFGFVVALAASPAMAADKLELGAPPPWVKASPYPAPAALPEDGGPIRILRLDQQLHFGPDGDSTYQERVAQVRTSLGLTTLGTISLSWNPGQETLTVHKVRLVREGQAIDVLAKQSFTVIRREAQLEQIVDGQLTATLQPEDLRVGDILEVAYTLTRKDPVMGGRTDVRMNAPGGQIENFSVRASWPSDEPITWRAGSGLPAPKVTKKGGMTELTLELKKLEPVKAPAGAPQRYWPTRELEFSEFRSWAEVAAQVAPLFDKASQLAPDSPLKAEAAKIAARTADPKARAGEALKLVQEQVRYLGLILQDGGYTPVHADETWRRRFGECKAKSVLLVALLRELGIKAEPALVNAYGAEGLDRQLPRMGAFNHVIVRAEIGGKVYWMDGTRTGDGAVDALDVPSHDFALPIRPDGAQLVALVQTLRDKPDTEVALDIDASGGIEAPAPVKGTLVMRGDRALWPGLMSANMPAEQREKTLKAMWSRYNWLEVKSVKASRDPQTGESRVAMEGTAKLNWARAPNGTRALYVPDATAGGRTEFKREPGPGADAPFAVQPYPFHAAYRLNLKLPRRGEGFVQPAPDIDTTVAGRRFVRRTTHKDGVLAIAYSYQTLAPEFPASEAKAAGETLARLGEQRVMVQAPRYYRATDADVAAWLKEEPKTAADFISRGSRLMSAGKQAEGLADFEKAIALDENSSMAYASRGLARIDKGDFAGGKADLDNAAGLDPRNAAVQGGLGVLALRDGRYEDAVRHFTRSADLAPNNVQALGQRAQAHLALGDTDAALADFDEILKIDPHLHAARLGRANVWSTRGERDRALAEIDKALADEPETSELHLYRAGFLATMGRTAEAEAGFAKAIALRPSPEAYLTRARYRPATDKAGRLADVAAAEKLEPDNPAIPRVRADVLADAGDFAGALAALNRALKAKPDDTDMLEQRARIHARAGKTELALKDFAAVRAKAGANPQALNSLCWSQATSGVALEAALADCEKALAAVPKAAHIIDSKAFVLMRLGRLKEALATYDAALSMRPQHPESLYGRGLTKLRLGLDKEAQTDLAAARTAAPRVVDEFAGYGLRPEAAPKT